MKLSTRIAAIVGILGGAAALVGVVSGRDTKPASTTRVLRVGYFPNVTHAQGVIGAETSREGRGWFEKRLGPGVKIQWFAYNAGPSAMEALLAGSIDMTYVGPNPALNVYIRSAGDEVRVMSGAAEGGAALVIHQDSRIASAADFKGRRIGTPQLGNTQDVAARSWFKAHGLQVTLTGGDVQVIPTANPDQLTLFSQGRLDGVWTVEPWVSRLVLESNGKVFLAQSDAVTTVLVAAVRALREKPALVARFVEAHRELTEWINAHPDEARELVRTGLAAETRRAFSAALMASAWSHLKFTDKVPVRRFETLVRDAQSVGFLRNAIPLDRLFSRRP
ncbi:putative aliphatic sulfonates-binding protein precursor [mine drainage metagenome]|uniref:Putative aliphatic sulfonates-binding protein n=1 Tax=mine drainage metagenome TaxID=410659 RepID=A0A1J5SHB5_9ZZZZ